MELKEIITKIDNLTNLNASIYFQNHLEQSDYTEIKNNDKKIAELLKELNKFDYYYIQGEKQNILKNHIYINPDELSCIQSYPFAFENKEEAEKCFEKQKKVINDLSRLYIFKIKKHKKRVENNGTTTLK